MLKQQLCSVYVAIVGAAKKDFTDLFSPLGSDQLGDSVIEREFMTALINSGKRVKH